MSGICNSWSELINCNVHFRALANSSPAACSGGRAAARVPEMALGQQLMKPPTMLYRNLIPIDIEESIRAKAVDAEVLISVSGKPSRQSCSAPPAPTSPEAEVEAAVERCVSELGSLDFIHNNAGVQLEQPLHETSEEQWDWVNDVNLKGVFFGCKHAVLAMLASGKGGSIVNTASISPTPPIPSSPPTRRRRPACSGSPVRSRSATPRGDPGRIRSPRATWKLR